MRSNAASAATPDVQVLLFEVGGCRYGADAAQVVRVDRPRPEIRSIVALGVAKDDCRALVFEGPPGVLNQLAVDVVRGVRSVPLAQLRRLPNGISPQAFAIGVWLDGNIPVLLVDLAEIAPIPGGQ